MFVVDIAWWPQFKDQASSLSVSAHKTTNIQNIRQTVLRVCVHSIIDCCSHPRSRFSDCSCDVFEKGVCFWETSWSNWNVFTQNSCHANPTGTWQIYTRARGCIHQRACLHTRQQGVSQCLSTTILCRRLSGKSPAQILSKRPKHPGLRRCVPGCRGTACGITPPCLEGLHRTEAPPLSGKSLRLTAQAHTLQSPLHANYIKEKLLQDIHSSTFTYILCYITTKGSRRKSRREERRRLAAIPALTSCAPIWSVHERILKIHKYCVYILFTLVVAHTYFLTLHIYLTLTHSQKSWFAGG